MYRHLAIVACGMFILFAVALGSRAEVPAPALMQTTYRYEVSDSPLPPVDARAYLVADVETGEVLVGATTTTPYPLASVTKLFVASELMTNFATTTTTITHADIAAPEPFGKLAAGEVYTMRELLFPYLIESSNDAGVAIARFGGGALQDRITAFSQRVSGPFSIVDTTGLSPQNVASAEALLEATRIVYRESPGVFDITRLPQYQTAYSMLVNNSPVISYPGYRGGKHGYTPEAGRTLVAIIDTPFPDGIRPLVYIILGATDIRETFSQLETLVGEKVTRASETSAILPPSSVE